MQEESGVLLEIWNAAKQYMWGVLLAVWGGTVNYVSSINSGARQFKWSGILGEWAVSGFAGFLVASICIELEWSTAMTAFATGMGGHMGGRCIFVMEQLFKDRIGVKDDGSDRQK